MLLALKKAWSRRAVPAAPCPAADARPAEQSGPGSRDSAQKPVAEVIDLAVAQALPGKRSRRLAAGSDAGMATAEYAIATLAAVGFAGLLVLIMRSGEVRGMLMNIIEQALSAV